MRLLSSCLLAGAAIAGSVLVASSVVPSVARELDTHQMTIHLPGGGIETITYSGKVVPQVRFAPVLRPSDFAIASPFGSFWSADFGMPSLAAFDHMAAEMDARMNAMLQQAGMLNPSGVSQAVLRDLPAGTTSFSVVERSDRSGACTQVTRVTRGPGDAKPRVVTRTSGDCAAPSLRSGRDQSDIAQDQDGLTRIDYRAPGLPM